MEAKDLACLVVRVAEDHKAEAVLTLGLQGVSPIADYFVICTGRSSAHVQALARRIEEALEDYGIRRDRIEGYQEGRWVLLDFGTVVVHVFRGEERSFFDLERLWGDAIVVDWSDGKAGTAPDALTGGRG